MTQRLIFVCGNLYPYNLGGAEVYNYYLMQSMAQKADVVCVNTKTDQKVNSVKHERISAPFLPVLLFPFFTAIKLALVKNKQATHVVLTFSRSKWFYWIYYPILKQLFGLNYTIIIHGGGLTNWGFKLPFKWFFKNAHSIVGISDRIRNEYEKRTGVQIKFLPPLIPFAISELSKQEARAKVGIAQEAKVVLQVGSLKAIKHPETAIQAFQALGKSYLEQHHLVVVYAGDGPDRSKLEKLVLDSGLSNYFRFLGNVAREDVKHVYRQADLYLIASDFEGTPLSMLEAMANDIPVLASNAPGINTVITDDHNGRLFTIGNGNELAGQIKSVIANPEIAANLTQNAKATINTKYDHKLMLRQLEQMWNI